VQAAVEQDQDRRRLISASLRASQKRTEKGEEEIRFHQKLIWIADHSDWGVVEEYLVDELADDSDDEKQLF